MLPAFSTGLGSPLWIMLKVAATFVTAFTASGHSKIMIFRKAALMVGNACAAFPGDLALLGLIHRSKTAF